MTVGTSTIIQSRIGTQAPQANNIIIIGTDVNGDWLVSAEVDAAEVTLSGERLSFRRVVGVLTQAELDGIADYNEEKMRSEKSVGVLTTQWNVGVELYDVVEVDDQLTSPTATSYRVLGIQTTYDCVVVSHVQQLILGAV